MVPSSPGGIGRYQSVVTLASSGATVVGGSLVDGKYSPTISAPLVTTANGALDGNGDGVGGDNYTVVGSTTIAPKLFRLFGDADGDGDVDITELLTLWSSAVGSARRCPERVD